MRATSLPSFEAPAQIGDEVGDLVVFYRRQVFGTVEHDKHPSPPRIEDLNQVMPKTQV